MIEIFHRLIICFCVTRKTEKRYIGDSPLQTTKNLQEDSDKMAYISVIPVNVAPYPSKIQIEYWEKRMTERKKEIQTLVKEHFLNIFGVFKALNVWHPESTTKLSTY